MKRHLYFSLLAMLLTLTCVQPVLAQDEGGLGAFLDWIHKLSGPRMVGGGVTGWISPDAESHWRFRMSASMLTSSTDNDRVQPAGTTLRMLRFEPTVEYQVADVVDLGTGLSLDRYGGDADGFTHWSFPVYGQLRLPSTSRVQFVMAAGARFFPTFADDDFAPLVINAKEKEGQFWFRAGFEVVR